MKVLVLAARFPYPPDRGDRLTTLQMLRALSRRHAVTLATFRDGHETAESEREVKAVCERLEGAPLSRARSWAQAWLGLLAPVPSQVSYFQSHVMRDLVARLCRETRYDAIFVQTFRMAPFVRALQHPAKVIYLGDSHALALALSIPFQPWWKRPGIVWERHRVARYEARVSREFRECWVLAEADLRDFAARDCRNLVLLQHGVDDRLFDLPLGVRAGAELVFLGNMSVPHNVDAATFLAREIWPCVCALRPDAALTLAGASPTRAVRELATIPGVTVTGALADLSPLWRRCAVAIAPLRFSTGIQNKVLEPMAAGVPVVTTPQVADGIGARDGEHLRVAEGAEALARATAELLSDPGAGLEMARRARDLVRERFSWDTLVKRLESVAAQGR